MDDEEGGGVDRRQHQREGRGPLRAERRLRCAGGRRDWRGGGGADDRGRVPGKVRWGLDARAGAELPLVHGVHRALSSKLMTMAEAIATFVPVGATTAMGNAM